MAKRKQRSSVRIVVAGEPKTGKSSLILAATTGKFSRNVPSVLPFTGLSGIPATIIDTDSDNRTKLVQELKRADAVVLTYATDRIQTLDQLISFWLPELHRLDVKVPVILVGCMIDRLQGEFRVSYEQMMSPIMQHFPEIETCLECSASEDFQTAEVFHLASNAVLHPRAPLVDDEDLKPRFVSALTQIFYLCDADGDGFLNDGELNEFQKKCFRVAPKPFQTENLKRAVGIRLGEEGVSEDGLTLTGFIVLHASFIESNRLDTIWTVLTTFGYDHDLELATEVQHSHVGYMFHRGSTRKSSLTFALVGAAVASVGLGAYRIYAARKSSGG